ncbi:MAG: chemotaxis protein histidine kinase CheA, partial [bacterium]
MSDELQDMIQGFVEEAQENFDAIESNLLIFEENPEDKDIINGIFRVMHTIKGTAGFMGLDDIQALAHKLESIFDLFRRSELVATPEVLDTILPGIDLLKQMVLELIEAERSEYPFESTIVVLEELAKGNTKSTIQKKPEPAQPKIDTPQSVEEESNFDDDLGLEISEDILKEFVVEAEEHLVTIEENLLSLEKTPNSMESINELFRAIHSIKGTSDYVRLPKITTLSHSLETIFDRIRKGKSLQYTAELADMVLKSIDLLRTLVFMVKMGDDDTIISIDEQLEQLSQFLGNEKEDEKPAKNKSSSVGKSAFENLSSQQCMVIENLGMKIIESNATVNDLTTFHRSLRTLGNAAEKIGAADSTAIIKQLEDLVVSILAEETTQDSVKSSVSVLIANLITSIQGVSNGSTRTTQSKETASSQNTQNGALTPVKENEKKDA